MRKTFHLTSLLFVLVVSGCAGKIERAGVNNKKASIANTELGVAYLARGKHTIAMNKLKKAIAYDNENADAHNYIAELYRRLEQNDLAREHFIIAMELNDEDSSIKNNYAIFLCGSGSYEKGLSLLNKVLLDPLYSDKGQAYENMGLCTEKGGNIFQTEKFFTAALKFNKNLPAALLGLAQISFDKQKVNVADDYLARHLKLARPSAQSLWLELLIARHKGQKGRAGSLALKLKQYFPESREALLLKKLKFR